MTLPSPNHGKEWTSADEDRLVAMFVDGCRIGTLCRSLGRRPNAITSRLAALGLLVAGEAGYQRVSHWITFKDLKELSQEYEP